MWDEEEGEEFFEVDNEERVNRMYLIRVVQKSGRKMSK